MLFQVTGVNWNGSPELYKKKYSIFNILENVKQNTVKISRGNKNIIVNIKIIGICRENRIKNLK